ncbi:hypothetical protein [Luteolibacter marinus]|uniref:hypothetical protein n=1 Tax=Luteolibacter marinus TaxID=2776705 RepID=UPI0018687D19|nr:hypothetical protein [Luteolibacter marinus]
MIRIVPCLALTCLFAACAPPKAQVVEGDPVTPPKQTTGKPAPRVDEEPEVAPPMVRQESGMRIPDVTGKLPDERDMNPTVPVANAGGPVIATPPKDGRQVSE